MVDVAPSVEWASSELLRDNEVPRHETALGPLVARDGLVVVEAHDT